MFVIKPDLRANETIWPQKPVLGFCEGYPVYLRRCVQSLKTREMWFREAKQPKADQKPHKTLVNGKELKKGKQKPSIAQDDEEGKVKELFGEWQTEPYVPPIAEGGQVPRMRERGDTDIIEVWCPELLPRGCVHLKESESEEPAAQAKIYKAVCKRFGIDFCKAMVGFERQAGRAIPKLDGIVLCAEYVDTVLAAAREEAERAINEGLNKQRKAALKRWKELLTRLVIEEELRNTNFGR